MTRINFISEKNQRLSKFGQDRTSNRRTHVSNTYESTITPCFPSPTCPYLLQSMEYPSNQRLRPNLEAINSSKIPHVDIARTKPST